MKKGSKPVIASLLFILLLVTGVVLTAVAIRFKYEELVREKDELRKQIKAEQTKNITLIANYQMYTEEIRIKEIARRDLNLVDTNEKNLSIKINKNDIYEIINYFSRKQ